MGAHSLFTVDSQWEQPPVYTVAKKIAAQK